MAAGSRLDASALRFTLEYLQTYEQALLMARSSEALIQAMLQRYPELPGVSSLQLGAQVVMGRCSEAESRGWGISLAMQSGAGTATIAVLQRRTWRVLTSLSVCDSFLF